MKYTFASLILLSGLMLLNLIEADAQQIEWQKTIGGSDLDALRVIRQTTDGGYILGGASVSGISGDKTENNQDTTGAALSYDYWIVKTNSTGNIQWQKNIGGNCSDYFSDIIQTADGGYLCGGHSKSPVGGDKTEPNRDPSLITSDNWLVKLDATGNIQWQKTYGGDNVEYFNSIFQTTDGGYMVASSSGSNISGDKTENTCNSTSSFDYWIIKLDASGNILWQNDIGGGSNDLLWAVRQANDGGYICGGYSQSYIGCDKNEDPFALLKDDYWVLKLDTAGNIQWQNTFGGTDHDKLRDIQPTADGGYICAGESSSNASGDKTENSNGSSDFWIVKLDAAGAIEWQNTIGGSDYDVAHAIIQTFDGGYVAGGQSNSGISGDKTDSSRGNSDYWIVKLSATGNIQWQNTMGGTLGDNLFSIEQTSDGDFILGGESNSGITGDKTDSSRGDYDYWVLKLNNQYNLITGKLFADVNSNSIQDIGEPDLPNRIIVESSTGNIAFSEQDGNYSIALADTGNFSISSSALDYYTPVPATHSVYFNSTLQTDSLNDFIYQPAGVYNDLCLTITPLGPFRSGFITSYMINYINSGTTVLNGSIKFFPDPNLSYVSSTLTPATVSADSIEWNVGSLIPFQSGNFVVIFNISTGLALGTTISSVAVIDPVINDANPACNSDVGNAIITGSFDPNDILVSEDTLLSSQFPNPPYLDYIIRFQNTGTDTAFTVSVLNPIDTNRLELSSLEFINASHPVNLKWLQLQRQMQFKFENILLPDSNTNEPLSHGFVRYRIKPKATLIAGDNIANNAHIYFDFNAPVATNTVVTEIVLAAGLTSLSQDEKQNLRCFPNPATNEITITGYSLKNDVAALISVFDIMGKLIYRTSATAPYFKLQTSNFPGGLYFVEVKSGDQSCHTKFVKQ